MAISDQDKARLNRSMPVANDVKLGDILQNLQKGGSNIDAYTKAEADAKFQPKGNYAKSDALSALEARIKALEDKANGGV